MLEPGSLLRGVANGKWFIVTEMHRVGNTTFDVSMFMSNGQTSMFKISKVEEAIRDGRLEVVIL